MSSTILWNGNRSRANDSLTTSRQRSTVARNDGSPDRSVRSTIGLRKQPSTRADFAERFAFGEPTRMSSLPVYRWRSAWKVASITTNGVVPCAPARSRIRCVPSTPIAIDTEAPCPVRDAWRT